MSLCKLVALVLGLGLLFGENANAGMLSYNTEVTVLAGSSVGSNVFLTDTAVKFTGLFDPANTYTIPATENAFSLTPFTSLQIEIAGLGVYCIGWRSGGFHVPGL
ncbi:MAG: hypothetical protein NTU79_00260 [Planctomycetota bacterium]|nr:hypothetical protein [Planctomycetota bacterium]